MASPFKLRLRTANATGGGVINGGGAGKRIPATYFGIHVGALAPTTIWGDYDANAKNNYKQVPIPELKQGLIRLWDSNGCSWRNIERTRHVFSWDRLDNAITLAKAAGLKIIYTLGCGPDWATTLPGQKAGLYVGYNPHPPSDIQYWIDWCTAVATRYKNSGIVYEIWNEVNDQTYGPTEVGSGYAGTLAKLLELARVAKETIKAIDPTAKFTTPNFTTDEGMISAVEGKLSLDTYLAAGGGAYADIISIHGYNTSAPWMWPEGVITHGKRIHDIFKSHNLDSMPVWNTEWGYGQWVDEAGVFHKHPEAMTEDHATDYITRMVLLSWCAGFELFGFYGHDASTSYATIKFIEPSNPTVLLKPALAYKHLAELLTGGMVSGFRVAVDGTGQSYYVVSFTTADNRVGRIMWTPGYSTATLPVGTFKEFRNALGEIQNITTTINLTKRPLFCFY